MVMDRRAFLQGSLGLAGALVLGGCASSRRLPAPIQGGDLQTPSERLTVRLTNGGAGDVGLPNPFAYQSGPGYELVSNVYDTLLLGDYEFGATITPWLASGFIPSTDGVTYEITLREAAWSDGRPLTAADVAFSFEYFESVRATLPPNLLGVPEGVAEVRVTGDRSLQIRLEEPSVPFARNVLTLFPIVPRHVWSGVTDPGSVQDRARLIGSGPFPLAEYTPGEGTYRFEANERFFLGRPFVRAIEYLAVGDDLAALQAGEIDVASPGGPVGVPPGALAPFRRGSSFVVESDPPDLLTALYWNLTKEGPLRDVRFRQACARAIDRQALVERITGGTGEVGNPGFLPARHPYRIDVEQYAFDIAAANAQLDGAGYARGTDGVRQAPGGSPLRFRLLTLVPPLGQLLAGMLGAIGIELEVEPAGELQQVFEAVGRGEFDMAAFVYGGIQGDPDFMRGVFSSRVPPEQKAFFGLRGYANSELDDVLDRQRGAFDEVARRELVARAQRIVASDLPLLHLFYPERVTVWRRNALDDVPMEEGVPDKIVYVTGKRTSDLTIRPSR